MAKMEAQEFRCAYTGIKLIPGVNASVDHIIPRKNGGGNDIENLQWVAERINRMKTDMTHEEFLDMCRLVLSHAKQFHSPMAAGTSAGNG